MNDLIRKCRYFKGEPKCPSYLYEQDKANIWDYENLWVESEYHRDENNDNTREYLHYGLGDFNREDGTPLTLKALLFNRYTHWVGGYSIEEDIKGFKEWYREHYLGIR